MSGRTWFSDEEMARRFCAKAQVFGTAGPVQPHPRPAVIGDYAVEWLVPWDVPNEFLPAFLGEHVARRLLRADAQFGLPGLVEHEGVTNGQD